MSQISVIIPVYNVEKYLCRCIDSILAQSFNDFDIILVDDGSPDNSGKICDDYAKKDSRIHVIHKKTVVFPTRETWGLNGHLITATVSGLLLLIVMIGFRVII